MKWNARHKEKKQPIIMHTDSGFCPSNAFSKKWIKYAEEKQGNGEPYLDCEQYYKSLLNR